VHIRASASETFKFVVHSLFLFLPNVELSRSRRRLRNDEASERQISHRDRKQKGGRLSAPVKS
jgi:hypothetical protein